jgi:type II secretory ATPase GspE/PulE/Tfp pilus assembly ATPase PilB-like protein
MSLSNLYHAKQQEILRRAMTQDYFMLINHGAKRSGKTVSIMTYFYMSLLERAKTPLLPVSQIRSTF